MLSPAARNRLIPVIVSLPMLVQLLDATSVATALPTMAADLQVSPLHLNLAITAYLMSQAVFLPLSSWFADRFGARTVFCAAILLFALGAASCGLASGLGQLVVSRIVQGFGGALMIPVGRLILLRTVPKTDLVRATVWFSVPATIGPVIGPALGGIVVTYASWRWIFLLTVPVCLLAALAASRFVENFRESEAARLDPVSFGLLAVGLAGLVAAFETVGRGLVPTWFVALSVALGIAALVGYRLHARFSANPAIDLSLLDLKVLRASILGGALLRIALGAQPFLIPLMLQLGFGFSPLASGLITLAAAAGALTTRFFLPLIVRALGFRTVLIWTTVLVSAMYVCYGLLRPDTAAIVILGVLFAGGLIRGALMVNLSTLGFSDVPQARMSRATALFVMVQQLTNSFGVTCSALLLEATLLMRHAETLGSEDFLPAFAVLAVMPLLALFYFIPLPPDAGAEVSGHRPARDD